MNFTKIEFPSESVNRAPNALLAAAVAYVSTKFNERATGKRIDSRAVSDAAVPRGVYTIASITEMAHADLLFFAEWYLAWGPRNMLGPWQAKCRWLESSQSIEIYLHHESFGEFKL